MTILDALDKDGASYDLGDGRTVRLSIEPDHDASVRDYECYGEVSEHAYRYTDREGRTERPDGFDGNAEKIEVDRGLWVWWQPPRGEMAWTEPDGTPARRGSETFRKCRESVIDLLRCGFTGVVLTVTDECDCCGQDVTETASLWGIDSLDDGYLADVVGDLLSELGIDGAK